jgi:hypothetical protein
MRENRQSGSEGGEGQLNDPSLPLSFNVVPNVAVTLRRDEAPGVD